MDNKQTNGGGIEQILEFRKRHRVVSHCIFWLAILLIGVSSSKYYDGMEFTYRFAFIADGLYLIPQILAAYFLTYVIIPAFFYRKRYVRAVAGFLTGSYLICFLCRFLVVRVAEPLAGVAPKAFETNQELLTNIPKLVYVYFFPVYSRGFIFLFIKLLLQQMDIQRRALTLEKEKVETELKLLKSQLNPHFLFNTLNNIYALSILNSPVTSSAIAKLAEILDYILYRCDNMFVPLNNEIALLNNYLALERLRYDDRLQVRFISRIDREAAVPPLLLLSLAENAFKHGASQDIGRPFINIDLTVSGDSLRYEVSNSVVNHPGNSISGKIGLSNLQKQLEILYPGRHTFTTGCIDDVFHAIVEVDLANLRYDNQVSDRG